MSNTVMVTGVSRHLGGAFVRRLSQSDEIERIIGVDVVPPVHGIGRAEFIRADIRNPIIGKIITQSQVDTVVHMSVIATPISAGGRVTQKEINVIGTMQLLAACQKAESIRRLIVKSASTVYGSSPRDPALFSEEDGAKNAPRTGWGKDTVEVEGYVRGFSRRRPDVDVAVLRLAHIIGPGLRTNITDYFSLPALPVPLGFDGRLQFLHEDDCAGAMLAATLGDVSGIVNVAADGVISVCQAAAMLGRPVIPVPHSTAGVVGAVLRRAKIVNFSPDFEALLAFGRVLDTTRMRSLLHFEPQYTTLEAFEDFARHQRVSVPGLGIMGQAVGDAVGSAASIAGQLVRGGRR